MSVTLRAGETAAEPERTPDPVTSGTAARTERPQHDLPVLEAYRGVAALLVLLTHVGYISAAGVNGAWAGWLSRGDFGVTLFFLLSGFLLFRPFVQASYGRRPPVGVRSYLRRRYVRIYPAFLVAVAGVFLLSDRARDQPGSLWLQSVFLVQNYFTNVTGQLDGLVQIWSLAVEVSFYLSLPLLAWLVVGRGPAGRSPVVPDEPAPEAAQPLSRRAAREEAQRSNRRPAPARTGFSLPPAWAPHRPAIVLAAMTVLALSWRLYYSTHNSGYNSELLWLPAFLDWFAAGMALAWLRERPRQLPGWLRNLAGAPGVCFSLALALFWLITQRDLGGPYDLSPPTVAQTMLKHVVYELIAILVLIPGVFGSPLAGWRRSAVNPVTGWLGTISFGVFLWHPILLEVIRDVLGFGLFAGEFWLTLVLTLAASLAVGTLSWRYLEEPTQRRFRNGFRGGFRAQGPRPGTRTVLAVPRIKVRWSARPDARRPARPAGPARAALDAGARRTGG